MGSATLDADIRDVDIRAADAVPAGRGVYCNRTLNLGAIGAIGYDMDYTLVHYDVEAWELCAYQHLQRKLLGAGLPVGDVSFDPQFVIRGLIIDQELGNIVKANRFGYIKRACHGTRFLNYARQRETYARTIVELEEPRWAFLNTFFSLSEACMYAQLVDKLDAGEIKGPMGYHDLYKLVRSTLDLAHMEGELKAQILADPARFVVEDQGVAQALLDQKEAGKKVLLITNSDWTYTDAVMTYAFQPGLPDGMRWREVFEVVVVSARKPAFFVSQQPMFEVIDERGVLRPCNGPSCNGLAFLGGTAADVERYLGLSGSDILYVGDHIYSDVHVSKGVQRWRTGVIVRELEDELKIQHAFSPEQRRLNVLMDQKAALEFEQDQVRLRVQRRQRGRSDGATLPELEHEIARLNTLIDAFDADIAPLARKSAQLNNRNWGLLMRTGNDKSHMARQIERHSDIYTSRVSNFLFQTPFSYLRSHRGGLPHDVD